jgi:hypothetical protein
MNNLLSRRKTALTDFISIIGIPVTTKECIDYLTQSNDVAYQTENRASILASIHAILTELEVANTIEKYKKEGTRDTLWYNASTLNRDNSVSSSPMRSFISNNFNEFEHKPTASILKKFELEGEEATRYIEAIGNRADTLSMIRADISRISLILKLDGEEDDCDDPTIDEEYEEESQEFNDEDPVSEAIPDSQML